MNDEQVWFRSSPSPPLPELERVLLRLSSTTAVQLGVTVAVPVMPSAQLFLAMPDEPAMLWATKSTICDVALGAARVCAATGPDRLHSIVRQAEHCLGEYQCLGLGASATLPRFFGGFSFFSSQRASTDWHDFPDADFTLPRFLYRSNGNQASLTLFASRLEIADPTGRQVLIESIHRLLASESAPQRNAPASSIGLLERIDNPNREQWGKSVNEACRLLNLGQLEKVVLAREMLLRCTAAPDIASVIERLLGPDDGSVRYAQRRGTSTFLGATPERLVSRTGSKIVTEALAGSAAADDPEALLALLEGDKDRREHNLVVQQIVNKLRALGAEVSEPQEPELQRFGPLLHLHTLLSARKLAAPHVLLLGEHLHPTPAVGGVPTELALDFLRAHESFDRGRYASPVGWFDRNGDGELAVALRSGLICGREVRLHAGAGLVRGSEAEGEWRETELKFRCLLDAIGLRT
jgi:menaquinone-specific isochorismate synthase